MDTCPFVGPLIPPLWISGDAISGLQSQSVSLICTWQRCTWCTFLEIHLWCHIYCSLGGQHGSWAKHWWDLRLGSAKQSKILTLLSATRFHWGWISNRTSGFDQTTCRLCYDSDSNNTIWSRWMAHIWRGTIRWKALNKPSRTFNVSTSEVKWSVRCIIEIMWKKTSFNLQVEELQGDASYKRNKN